VGRLQGQVAFLTGAGAGIAKATAKAYANEGAKVAIIEINRQAGQAAEREIREAGGEAIFVETDVTRDESVHPNTTIDRIYMIYRIRSKARRKPDCQSGVGPNLVNPVH